MSSGGGGLLLPQSPDITLGMLSHSQLSALANLEGREVHGVTTSKLLDVATQTTNSTSCARWRAADMTVHPLRPLH